MRHPLIDHLKRISPKELTGLYKRTFETAEGQLVLEDLKGRFWEYVPAPDIRAVGNEDVIKHIKNMINPIDEQEGVLDDSQQNY